MNKISLGALLIGFYFVISGCSASTNKLQPKKANDTKFENALKNNLDQADDMYIQMKSDDLNYDILSKNATALAKAHMDKKEYILANFYIQEALAYRPYDNKLKFLLVKNQYLAAIDKKRDQNYLERALKALEENQGLLTNYEDIQKAQKLTTEVKELLARSYLQTAKTYKRLNKVKAYNIYIEKINKLGINIEKISNKEVK